MESKLPKPSVLKRHGVIPKPVLPTDRIKSSMLMAFGSKSASNTFSNTTISGTSGFAPLSRDLNNIPENYVNRGRAASPENRGPQWTQQRIKLRRSRSACDLRDIRSLKRTENTLNKTSAVPPKIARFGSSNNVSATSVTNLAKVAKRPAASSSNMSLKRLGTNVQRPISTKPTISTSVKKSSSNVNAASSSNSVAIKTTTGKKIPPYDFKARYHDLLDKHKSLKEKYEEKCDQFGNLENLPDQLEETQAELIKTQDQLKHVQTESECLHRQVNSQTIKIDSLANNLSTCKVELGELKQTYSMLKVEHDVLMKEAIGLRSKNSELEESNAMMRHELAVCKEQLFQSNMERKELHNKVMDLRGNIRVFCRIRPPLEIEQDKPLCGWNYMDEATVEIQNMGAAISTSKQNSHVFSFDQVFHPNTTQEDIFEMVSPLIQSALDGYNICIFAYGQTGSGKTYTMDGIASNVGVIPRTVDLLFDSINNYKRLGWDYQIKVTFLEIYNEVLFDLLSNEPKDMEIRMSKHNKNEIYVSNITEEIVTSANQLRELMQYAKMNRATASTIGNERSSRSHAVTRMELTGVHKEKVEVSVGTINLVDLAGSESPKTSTRMTETKNINRSLSELTNVILALLQKQDHIPYRNSKLTHLLMPSLGGNSKTLMFINVAPFQDCFVESVKSLRFAATVNSCKMSKAKRNRFLNSSITKAESFDKIN